MLIIVQSAGKTQTVGHSSGAESMLLGGTLIMFLLQPLSTNSWWAVTASYMACLLPSTAFHAHNAVHSERGMRVCLRVCLCVRGERDVVYSECVFVNNMVPHSCVYVNKAEGVGELKSWTYSNWSWEQKTQLFWCCRNFRMCFFTFKLKSEGRCFSQTPRLRINSSGLISDLICLCWNRTHQFTREGTLCSLPQQTLAERVLQYQKITLYQNKILL